ncbi:MAG: Rpn family recombination-promoting nuclease/putative transposase [Gammaproteobacteria bacterium]
MSEQAAHDSSYKQLLSHPKMVRDLLIGFFRDDWVKDLDYTTLERFDVNYIAEDLRKKADDIVWRVRHKGEWLWVVLLIEFQSTVDKYMAVRMTAYLGLLYLDIIKQEKGKFPRGKLPPVLPLVIYNGHRPWTAPVNFHELLDDRIPERLKKYQPSLRYWLLDEGHCHLKNDIIRSDNVMAPLIALEQSTNNERASQIIAHLTKLLSRPEDDSLRRAYVAYLKRVYKVKKNAPDLEINELYEVNQMLTERVESWMQAREDKGKIEGRVEGFTTLIVQQIQRKFGNLSEAQQKQLQQMTDKQLLALGNFLVETDTLEDLFEQVA